MYAVRAAGRALASAVRLLTVVPVPGRREEGRADPLTATFFPVVGLLLGLPLAACALLPLPGAARGAGLLTLWTALTGGLHEDGWADATDAALAPTTPAERARILKDPRVGAHGLTATVLLLLLRFGALAAVPWWSVLSAPVLGRWAMAVSLAVAPPLFGDGLGDRYGRVASPAGPTLTALLCLLPVAGAGAGVGEVLLAWTGAALAAWGVGRLLLARLGGLNGDGHGAVGLAAETVALWTQIPLA